MDRAGIVGGVDVEHLRAFWVEPDAGHARALPDPERLDGIAGKRDRGSGIGALPELGLGDPVCRGKRVEHAVARKRGDVDPRLLDQLLDQADPDPRGPQRRLHRCAQLPRRAHERAGAAALAVGRAHEAGHSDHLVRRGHHLPACLRHSRLGKPLALAQLRGREHGGLRRERVRQAQPRRDPRRRADRRVRAGADHAVDALRLGQSLERGLVVHGDDRPPVGVGESGSGGVAIDRDHEQPAGARSFE